MSPESTRSKIKGTSQWKTTIMIKDYTPAAGEAGFLVEATEMTKQRSRQVAAMGFLKKAFPSSFTWNTLVTHTTMKKKPLEGFIDLNVKQNRLLQE